MASIIKTDNVQKVSDSSNIIKKCGSTITLGSCGASIALASGATQTGFGRTGSVNWCTTVKTSPLTAVSGNGYFVNTCGGAITVTLPSSPSAGDIVAVKDYKGTFDVACKALTLGRGGSKINSYCADYLIDTKNLSATLVYVDGTQGWLTVDDSTTAMTLKYVTATGGTLTTSGDYKIHTFNADGCFQVTCAGGTGSNKVSYVVVAGGGGAGGDGGEEVEQEVFVKENALRILIQHHL